MFLKNAKSAAINTTVILFVVAGFFGLGEIYSRIYIPDSVRMTKEGASYFSFMEYDEEIEGRALKKDFNGLVFFRFGNDFRIKTNSIGLRNSELSKESEGKYRILFTGDSFTMGYGVNQDETFPYQLSKRFDDNSSRTQDIEIINGGVSGWGAIQIRNFVRKRVPKIGPDMIVYSMFINDVYDTHRYATHSGRDNNLENWIRSKNEIEEYMSKQSFRHAVHFYLENNSYFYEFLGDRIRTAVERIDALRVSNRNWTSIGKIGLHNYQPWKANERGDSVIDHSKVVGHDMELRSWKVKSLADQDELALLVWRFSKESNSWTIVDQSRIYEASFGLNSFEIEPPLKALKGDNVGFYTKKGSIARLHPLDNMPRSYRAGPPEDASGNLISDYNGNYCMRIDGNEVDSSLNDSINTAIAKTSIEASKMAEVPESDVRLTAEAVDAESLKADIAKGDLELLKENYNQATLTAYNKTLKIIGEMRDEANLMGAKFYVTYIPTYIEAEKLTEGASPESLKQMIQEYYPLGFESKIKADLSSMGIELLSITKEVKSSPEKVLYLQDAHLNPKGNEVVADALHKILQEKLSIQLSKKAM